ncbi:MAG: WecB/TagA/CpsF family glycosyltransferase [Pyrinomonadaceae bacterium]|nr:WecB/TagA/CpsF family glycosyltransferase [Pyrinomonadaceae bacterium]
MPDANEKNQISESADRDRVRVLSLFPDVGDQAAIIEKTAELIKIGNGGYICFSTVHMVMESYDDPQFAEKVNGANYIATDGMPLVWMQKLQGKKHASRVRGNDFMILLLEFAESNDLKVGFYGGKQEVIDALLERAGKELPDLEIAYSYSPPFRALTEEESAEIVEDIKISGTQILFVGLGCPKQENWMSAHRDKFSAVMLGVGAAFDFYAGNLKESPRWISNLGLEWLYRLFQEPKRLWRRYLILNPRFLFLASLQLLGLKKFERE